MSPLLPLSIRGRFSRIKAYALAHKVISTIVLVAVIGGGYGAYKATHPVITQTHYILGTVATGTIVASVSESGQVSASDSVDVKPQVSGTITWVGVKAGDHVRAGQVLMTIDSTDAKQALDAAQKGLAADKLQYQKDAAQAPISYQSDLDTLSGAQQSLTNDYNSTYNHLTATYLDLPDIMAGADDVLYGTDFDSKKRQWNVDFLPGMFTPNQDTGNVHTFMQAAVADYADAKSNYADAVDAYKLTGRTASTTDMDALLAHSITMATAVAQALQSELNFLGAVSDAANAYSLALPSGFSTMQSNTRSYLSTVNSDLTTLLNDKKTLDNDKQAITNAQNAITLAKVGNPQGDNPISLQISQNSIEKEEQDIANQQADLAKYTIRAPFDGTLSAVDVKVGDSAGSSAVATVISSSQLATLSLNEIDAAKVAVGDKATLTFDAIDGLSLAGTVATIDTVGTVSQGVVSYDVDVSFDTQDARVKPGMTVNADIQTGVAQDTLVVPSSAVKTLNGQSYVEAFVPPIPQTTAQAAGADGITSDTLPQQLPVEVGISDDTSVQIRSGLSSGQQIVVSTRVGTGSTVSAAASATSRTGGATGARGFGGGNAIRIGG